MEEQNTGITPEERETAKYCIDHALSRGASQVRVSLGKNTLDSISFLNGNVDKVSHCSDRGVFINLFTDGRYGGYSTNRLDRESLSDFIDKALENTRMLAPDPLRCLPDPAICAKNAVTGNELGLTDPAYASLTAPDRLNLAAKGVQFGEFTKKIPKGSNILDYIRGGKRVPLGGPSDRLPEDYTSRPQLGKHRFKVISEECEWSDSTDDSYVVDSQGFEGRHRETSFNFWSEITIEGRGGGKYTGYNWESSPFLKNVDLQSCSPIALQRAVNSIAPKGVKSGKYYMIVENTSASRLVAPLLNALSAMSIQQNNSFLADSLGKRVFGQGLNIYDFATTPGQCGSRLFDSEGVATSDRFIIRNGAVEMYFVNTYMSRKMGLEPTIEGSSRPTVLPFVGGKPGGIGPCPDQPGSICAYDNLRAKPGNPAGPEEEMKTQSEKFVETDGRMDIRRKETETGIGIGKILELCDEGILVTGFNGGNCNPTTGNFSYGVEGYRFKNGRIQYPVKELLITGNMITLWNSLIAAGADAKAGTRWQVPTLAFKDVDFSA